MFISIEPRHIGPFSEGCVLQLEPDVTVITGGNDVGKSCILRTIQLMCDGTQNVLENEVNNARMAAISGAWQKDKDVGAIAKYREDKRLSGFSTGDGESLGWTVDFRFAFCPEPGVARLIAEAAYSPNGKRRGLGRPRNQFPTLITLNNSLHEGIQDSIDIGNPTPIERQLFDVAFGKEFTPAKIESVSPEKYTEMLNDGEEVINARIRELLPKGLQYRFRFLPNVATTKKNHLIVRVFDDLGARTSLSNRGTGARKFVSWISVLMTKDFDNAPHLVIADEPETSLHADAQRKLRSLFEAIAQHENVQVVYATHSPVMINPLKPQCVRAVTRESNNGEVRAFIRNDAAAKNFMIVRASLGMFPSDSLLYSDVGVVVEGASECRALPPLILKLCDAGYDGFENVRGLIDQFHLINGDGDSFDKLCRFAEAQDSTPVVLLDGDKKARLRELRKLEWWDRIPVIELPDGIEFEQIVPREKYFDALQAVHGEDVVADDNDPTIVLSISKFDEWLNALPERELTRKKMFSKQVEEWMKSIGVRLNKPRVMLQAVEITDVNQLHADCIPRLKDLLAKISQLAREKSSP